jgi:hypothetical protein
MGVSDLGVGSLELSVLLFLIISGLSKKILLLMVLVDRRSLLLRSVFKLLLLAVKLFLLSFLNFNSNDGNPDI